MRLDKACIRIGDVDITEITRHLKQLPDSAWKANTYRQNTYAVHKQTESLVLYFKTDEFTETNTELLSVMQPLLAPIFARFAQYYGYSKLDIAKLMFAKLPAGAEIAEHSDSAPIFARYHRVHVPIVTNDAVMFYLDQQPFHFKTGVMYDINNLGLHRVVNPSDEDRIHLIFDARPVKRIQNASSHLFILSPNNSGSSLMSAALSDCQNAITLPGEGHYIAGFAGPNPNRDNSHFVWSQFNTLNKLQCSKAYDWPAIRNLWSGVATPQSGTASIFVEKSPCNIARMAMLAEEFDDAKFLFLIRNPYAMFESVVRARRDLPEVESLAAQHVLWCFRQQEANLQQCESPHLLIRYEDVCDSPEATAQTIRKFIPAFEDIDFIPPRWVKGQKSALDNRNATQIARLTDNERAVAEAFFQPNAELFARFGYPV
ncbi:sulfotransferase [Photobacterium sp. 53610]|uniref:sulfotransferase n=1 Tax=Photobacterium sp. 53610 TaxID=3102789 RepID=UPI002EDADBF8